MNTAAVPDFRGTAVVVVNYGSSALLAEHLTRLTRDAPGLVTVVVDNLTTTAERARLQTLATAEGWYLVEPSGNLGFGAGVNAGVELAVEAGASRFVILNPDAELLPAAAAALFAACEADPSALVAPRILRPDGSLWFGGSDLYLDDGRIRSRRRRLATVPLHRIEPWLTGACLAIGLSLWREIGGFSDEYFLYWEDVDLSHKVVAAGGTLLVLDGVTAVHAEGGTQAVGQTSSGQAKSGLYYFYNIRNRLVFAALHLSERDKASWRRSTLAVSWEILLQGGRKQLLTNPSVVWTAVRAIRDGRRLAARIRAERASTH
ncbi:glycosyltransferase family 2 protein [Plantibacter cousiniae (nom. nud.)]|uniref:glycosyltransferase family 2 protein n=1 Tax=Plantibacter cousiniae (nom. nud.) TaxID=199709 RepID=UPI001DBC6B86|nr:glycosyltransferase family 2 protein [Plantibacter cousiniae]CAH0184802.1 N-acetylglucosaminyl-diphospho-decaprenol L-rhamnosyltransferase [Plantibacter cousiniae]